MAPPGRKPARPPRKSGLDAATWGGGRFVAVGDKSTIVYGDGDAAWTRVDTGGEALSDLFAVASSGSRFVAVGETGAVVYSADGNRWTEASDTATEQWLGAVTWGGGRFVAVGGGGTIVHSNDAPPGMRRARPLLKKILPV